MLDNAIIFTGIPPFSAQPLTDCFREFMAKEASYKEQFLQKHYGYAFDGYSYLGQTDSSNQAYDDLVYSFVFSNFFPASRYPPSFQAFLKEEWPQMLVKIREIELSIITSLNLPGLLAFYRNHIGHMFSNNYYPPVDRFQDPSRGNTRLSEHPDVSLFTIFPFGIDGDFQYQNPSGRWQSLKVTNQVLAFPGYLLELWSGRTIKALNHRVAMPQDRQVERFSFASFSLPFPKRSFRLPAEAGTTTSERYFNRYLSLFEE